MAYIFTSPNKNDHELCFLILVIILCFNNHMFLALQESDKEGAETPNTENNYGDFQQPGKIRQNYRDQSPEDNIRLSRSSLSENCSSPSDQFDDYRPGFDEGDDGDGSTRPSFQDSGDTFYNKVNSDQNNKFEETYSGEYSEKSKRMMKNMGFKPGKGLGKFEHGRTQPVEASTQKGRRGLGAKPSAVGAIPEIKHITEESKPEAKEQVVCDTVYNLNIYMSLHIWLNKII